MVGEVIAGRYELEELAGTGGMSSVYRAYDRLLERRVALKILHEHHTADDHYVERFRREARSVAQLAHPNIVTVIDRGEEGGRQFIVFEYVEGENLKDVVERRGPLPVAEALELAIEIGRALAFAHAQGLVHRDVKPQNVLLNGEGRPKVTDFGIARSLDLAEVTQSGAVVGTSSYIAPEQASGEAVDAQTDVYSLGVVLFELLTGALPFTGESFVTVALQHVNEPPPSVHDLRRDVPPPVAAAIERALEKNPDERFPSMRAFARELEACLHEVRDADTDATMVIPARVRERPRPARRRRRGRAVPVLVTLLVLAASAGIAVALVTQLTDGGSSSGSGPVRLQGVAAFDPEGTGGEHDADARLATDRDPATFWRTETYQAGNLDKSGVGIVLAARRAASPARLTVMTDAIGGAFTADVRAGDSPSGPFQRVSGSQTVTGTTTFRLRKTKARYFLVWITQLSATGVAHVNEVRARA